jgi:DNA-binding LytR/AlgR family response regulator
MFLQATGNYTWLYWRDGQRMLMPRTLKYYIPQLPAEWFVRLHRNCVVNLGYIERIERINSDKGGLVYLPSGVVLPVSRRRWFATKRLLSKHVLFN